ncbi:fluoride efflux transporter FluC [Solicola sp. PLA-1-18]|uniref:fluoride efflux transporter FluC n=1 Tax=Solicola sp. PLA-1-18 TaxID=3380532 RepID=UPI003B76EC04
MTALLVLAGGVVGAPARYLLDVALTRAWGRPRGMPVGILTVNVLGSFALGLVVGSGLGPSWEVLLGTGFCGAFTTWSTLALELWAAVERRAVVSAAANLGLSLVVGVAGAWGGLVLATG